MIDLAPSTFSHERNAYSIPVIAETMRHNEQRYEHRIPVGKWIVVRLDGRGFSDMTEIWYKKPFDERFHDCMCKTSEMLLREMQGVYVYTGSDEISLLLSPEWGIFDRRASKITTLSASLVSVVFTDFSGGLRSQFDARINVLDSLDDVVKYFLWRRADVQRCALHTLTFWTLLQDGMTRKNATSLLHRTDAGMKEVMLKTHNISFKDIPSWQRQGVGLLWEQYQKKGYNPIQQVEVVAQRKRVLCVQELPPFDDNYARWLVRLLTEDNNG